MNCEIFIWIQAIIKYRKKQDEKRPVRADIVVGEYVIEIPNA